MLLCCCAVVQGRQLPRQRPANGEVLHKLTEAGPKVEEVRVQACVEARAFLLIGNLVSSFVELCCSTPGRFSASLPVRAADSEENMPG